MKSKIKHNSIKRSPQSLGASEREAENKVRASSQLVGQKRNSAGSALVLASELNNAIDTAVPSSSLESVSLPLETYSNKTSR